MEEEGDLEELIVIRVDTEACKRVKHDIEVLEKTFLIPPPIIKRQLEAMKRWYNRNCLDGWGVISVE